MSEAQKLETSKQLIKECLIDLYIKPRKAIMKWSKRTNQTAQVRLAYPSQHIASLITGLRGMGTAARGDDLSDGSEVKSCSRADQLSECRDCKAKVLVLYDKCPMCGSSNINIKTDSHWIFSIKDEDELDLLLNKIPKILLVLFDRKSEKVDDLRLRVWIINPKEIYIQEFFKDYFYNNYRKKNDPAPCNLHPLKYDFFMMRPSLIFYADIDIEQENVDIIFWNLKNPREQKMPTFLLTKKQLIEVFGDKVIFMERAKIINLFKEVPTEDMHKLIMREKILKTYKKKYQRR